MFSLSLMGFRVKSMTIKVQKRRNSEVLRKTSCLSGTIWYQSAKMDRCLIKYCLTSAWTMLLLCHGWYSYSLHGFKIPLFLEMSIWLISSVYMLLQYSSQSLSAHRFLGGAPAGHVLHRGCQDTWCPTADDPKAVNC